MIISRNAAGVFIAFRLAFLWALKSGQFDDMEGAANRILFDDEPPECEGD